MKLNQAVSERLLQLLAERNMTQYQLYMKSGVPKSTISNSINCSYDSVMEFVSHTVSELKTLPCPEQFKEILPFYLIKYSGKKEQLSSSAVQLSLIDDSDVVIEEN